MKNNETENSTNANTTSFAIDQSNLNVTEDYSGRANIIKRASSQGVAGPSQQSNRRSSRDGNFGVSSVGEPVGQSSVFTEFKVRSPDNITNANQTGTMLPELRQSQSSAKQREEKQPDVLSPNSTTVNPALSGKPPKSIKSKTSYSAAKESVKTAHSIKSPNHEKGSARASPARPQALEPIANPPQLPSSSSN